jgi:hypothetical protein
MSVSGSPGAKGTNIYMESKCNIFLTSADVVCCCLLWISSPILLRLCSELLAHELLFVMNYKKSLIVCLLLAC